MLLAEIFRMAVYNLSYRKTRTFLTILGIVIGVAAIVGMVGAAQGINHSIISQIEKFQSNIIDVVPGKFSFSFSPDIGIGAAKKITPLTEKDAEEISKIPGVDTVSSTVIAKKTVEFGNEKYYLTIMGIDPESKKINTLELDEGRYISSSDETGVLIGYSVAHDLFENEVKLKKKITIENSEYKVIGIFKKAGGFLQSLDSIIYMPKKTAREKFGLDKEQVADISVKVKDNYDVEAIGEKIEKRICKLHKSCDDKDFTVITPKFSQEISSQILSLMQILMGGIAGISLVVGTIGIANMMYTAVLERTHEIGILKAIGATDNNIMTLFLIESGIIGIIGGVVGIIAGYILGEGFLILRQSLISRSGITTGFVTAHILVTPGIIIASLGISFVVGIIAGVFPARKAAKLQPVEALRSE